MPERSPNPQRRNTRSQEAILKAAYQLCQEQGYGRLTIEAIAARAGVGKQTIYRWWPSKGALALDVFLQTLADALDDAEEPSGIREVFRARLRALVRQLRNRAVGPHIAALLGEAQVDPALAR